MECGETVCGRARGGATLYALSVMPPSPSFRFASSADARAVVELVERAYRGEASRAGWTTEADLLAGQRTDLDEVSSLIAARDTRILLAERTEVLVGSVLVALEPDAEAAYVGMVAVEPGLQAAGIGRALLGEVERIVYAERPGATLRMTVIAQRHALIAWYERRGYVRTGERAAFPYGQPRFGLPLRDDLYFEVLQKRMAR
jgi:ribosomal protein S18 acetylase RimI-like enzyme